MRRLIWGPPLYKTEIDKNLIKELLEYSKLQNIPNNEYLAGRIENEKLFNLDSKNYFNDKIMIYIKEYYKNILVDKRSDINIDSVGFELESLWVNFQKCNEYNPPHIHGGDISFVIYVQMPEEIKKEKAIGTSGNNGAINFLYGDFTYTIKNSNSLVEKMRNYLQPVTIHNYLPETADMFIFPSYLTHFVDSFITPNIKRISVSGNITLFENKIKGLL